MSSPAAAAIVAAHRAAARVQGGLTLYQIGDDGVEAQATVGSSQFQIETADAVRIEHTDLDLIYEREDLVLRGGYVEPAVGHRIKVFEGAYAGQTFEVMAPAGAQCYRLAGQGKLIRVHCKRVQ